MAALEPKYTQQPYIGTEGKVLLADRAYVAPTGQAKVAAGAVAGATPAGWTDQGSIDGSLATLDKADSTIVDVSTGLFEVLRGQVATKDGPLTAKYTMVEYDVNAWAAFSGDVGVSNGGATNAIFLGGNPLIKAASLLIGQNAATGTQYQHWNPNVTISWKIVEVNRFKGIECTIHYLKFTDALDAVPGTLRDLLLSMF